MLILLYSNIWKALPKMHKKGENKLHQKGGRKGREVVQQMHHLPKKELKRDG
jgi:hypothetical protein